MSEERLNPLNNQKDIREDAKKQATDYFTLMFSEFSKTPGVGMAPVNPDDTIISNY